MKKDFSRRNFVKGCLAAALAAGIPGLLSPEQSTAEHARSASEHTQARLMMGTIVNMTVSHHDRSFAHACMEKAFDEMERLQEIFDRHNQATPLGLLNSRGVIGDAPPELLELLAESLRLGRNLPSFDITVAPLVDYFSAHSNPQGDIRVDRAELLEAGALIDLTAVKLERSKVRLGKTGMALTLDGIAKGHIADRASKLLARSGAPDHLINAGGDIRASGRKHGGQSWNVAIQDPLNHGRHYSIHALNDGAMATSGGYHSFYDYKQRFHHLVDPASRTCINHFASVTVAAQDAKTADALATALANMPLEPALAALGSRPGCAALFVLADGSNVRSGRWA